MDEIQKEAKLTAWRYMEHQKGTVVKDRELAHKKEYKTIILQIISLTVIAVISSSWLVFSNYENRDLKQKLKEFTTIEQQIGQYNNETLKQVTYDVGEVVGENADNCTGLIQSIDDAVFCESVGI